MKRDEDHDQGDVASRSRHQGGEIVSLQGSTEHQISCVSSDYNKAVNNTDAEIVYMRQKEVSTNTRGLDMHGTIQAINWDE